MKREEALDVALGQIESQFGKGSIMRLSDDPKITIVRRYSHGLHLAGHRPGRRWLPAGRIIEIFGPESSGKTTLVSRSSPRRRRRWRHGAFIDAEHAMWATPAARRRHRPSPRLQPDTGEQALEIA